MREINVTAGGKAVVQALDAYLHDHSNKRCSLKAQGRLINDLVDAVAKFKEKHVKRVTIEDITIGTVKSITMRSNNKARNISHMKIVLVKREAVKE